MQFQLTTTAFLLSSLLTFAASVPAPSDNIRITVEQVPTNRWCDEDNDCPKEQFCTPYNSCVGYGNTIFDSKSALASGATRTTTAPASSSALQTTRVWAMATLSLIRSLPLLANNTEVATTAKIVRAGSGALMTTSVKVIPAQSPGPNRAVTRRIADRLHTAIASTSSFFLSESDTSSVGEF
ncbi:uncharacterized protein RAG0_16447 [Rhynchosporium agropyri]|uniref:Uncharacterized protein n=1 Tax=Rhynchosporium agropyri TaxID=914238 RepID=A0A1E1LQK2_9HELO|nr:uncharacterized protein RAG0_16447 [Rhynchosporium agropyri]